MAEDVAAMMSRAGYKNAAAQPAYRYHFRPNAEDERAALRTQAHRDDDSHSSHTTRANSEAMLTRYYRTPSLLRNILRSLPRRALCFSFTS